MEQPISAGCRAEVVDGLRGRQSPNLGLHVKVLERCGEHSLHGVIWLCEAEYAELGQEPDGTRDRPPGTLHFAQGWLKRLPPATTPPQAVTTSVGATQC